MVSKLRPQITDYSHLPQLPDPPRKVDMLQDFRSYDFRRILQLRLAARDDVLIAGGGYLRRQVGNNDERYVPDCVVAFGVNPGAIIAQNGYVVSDVGKPPDLVLEVGTRRTGKRDYTTKRDGYAGYGVQEYWRFDPSGGRYHDAPIAGDDLVDGQYQPFPINRDPDGLLWGYSPLLNLELCWDSGNLRLRDPATKEFLPTPEQERRMRNSETARADNAEAQAADAQAQAADAQARADSAEAQAAAERLARQSAEERIRLLEAEIRRRQDPDAP